jgi:hypothetical protein
MNKKTKNARKKHRKSVQRVKAKRKAMMANAKPKQPA